MTNGKKVKLLQDFRVYGNEAPVNTEIIDYKKKVALEIQKQPDLRNSEENYLIYSTVSRELDDKIIKKIPYEPKLILKKNDLVDNLFERFQTYIYTPTEHNFDCSSRLLVECKWYNKNVIFWLKDEDWNKGLYVRVKDLENCFNSLLLKKDDEIIKIINTV